MRMPLLLLILWGLGGCAAADPERGWVDQYNAPPFLCRSEIPLNEYQPVLQDLSQLQSDIERTLQLQANDRTIQVNIFGSYENYVDYVSQRVPEGATRPALFVEGPDMGRIYVYRHGGLATDVRHEATHALLHNALPYVPLWLDEGLAEYFETAPPNRESGNSHLRRVKWDLLWGWRPDLRLLEEKNRLTEMNAQDYRHSWAWVHFLLHESSETRSVLHSYLNNIREGSPPGRFSDYLSHRIPGAKDRFVQHFRNW